MSFLANMSLALFAGGLFSSEKIVDTVNSAYNFFSSSDADVVTKFLTEKTITYAKRYLEGCVFSCPVGHKKHRRIEKRIIQPNGCGAYGFKLFMNSLPEMEKCCNEHDICYGTCFKTKEKCDEKFSNCLHSFCKSVSSECVLFMRFKPPRGLNSIQHILVRPTTERSGKQITLPAGSILAVAAVYSLYEFFNHQYHRDKFLSAQATSKNSTEVQDTQ